VEDEKGVMRKEEKKEEKLSSITNSPNEMATSSFKKSKDIKGVMRISSNIIDCF
jgi:hypothetical protein